MLEVIKTLINVAIGAVSLGVIIAGPILMVWGWLDWAIKPAAPGGLKFLSLIGFAFGSASVLLAVGSLTYSHSIGGFAYYDPLLMKIYKTGFLLSLSGLILGLSGVWRKHLLRWRAIGLSVSTMLMWFAFAMGE